MQRLWRVLLSVLKIFAILILLLSSWLYYRTFPTTDTFFVENVEFQNPTFEMKDPDESTESNEYKSTRNSTIALGVQNHRLKSGNGIILGMRTFSPGSLGVDDEHYQKMTIWLRSQPKVGELLLGNREHSIAYYATGASAWPKTSCGGEFSDGKIEFLSVTPSTMKVKIDASVTCRRSRTTSDNQSISVNETFNFGRIEFKDLTPWLGLSGDHIYRETYR